MIKKKTDGRDFDKAAIISEYLTQENSFKSLGEKYGIPGPTIQGWVRAYRKNKLSLGSGTKTETPKEKELKVELRRAQLKNELLEEILEIAKQQTGVDLRKKYGARQS